MSLDEDLFLGETGPDGEVMLEIIVDLEEQNLPRDFNTPEIDLFQGETGQFGASQLGPVTYELEVLEMDRIDLISRALHELDIAINGNVKTRRSQYWEVDEDRLLSAVNSTLRTVNEAKNINWQVKDMVADFKAMCQYIQEEKGPIKLSEFINLRAALDNSYTFVKEYQERSHEDKYTPGYDLHLHYFEEGKKLYERYEDLLYGFKFKVGLKNLFYSRLKEAISGNYNPITKDQVYRGIKQIMDRD